MGTVFFEASARMGRFTQIALLLAIFALASGDLVRQGRRGRRLGGRRQQGRQGRQEAEESAAEIQGGVDFSGCVDDEETGLCCVEKEETITTVQKDPILECTHKNIETCQITFKQQAVEESVKKCYKPLIKECNGQGEDICLTVFESACTTKYVEKQPGKFVGDTSCEKLPVEICGAGCVTTEGEEECHDKTITSLIDVPEEVCDLNPQKVCKFQTKLVPKLKPAHECTIIPREVCHLKFSSPQIVEKPLKTKWCLDPTPAVPGESYEESEALGEPLADETESESLAESQDEPVVVEQPPALYGAPAPPPPVRA